MAQCETTLQRDTEEWILLGQRSRQGGHRGRRDKYASKARIQILDGQPTPKRYVHCGPLSSTQGDWLKCVDPGFIRYLERDEEDMRSMIVDIMIERLRAKEYRGDIRYRSDSDESDSDGDSG